jgi:hypothetical protein
MGDGVTILIYVIIVSQVKILFTEALTAVMRYLYKILFDNLKVRSNLEELDIDGNITLRWIGNGL